MIGAFIAYLLKNTVTGRIPTILSLLPSYTGTREYGEVFKNAASFSTGVVLERDTISTIGIIISSATFVANSIAEFTSACFSGSRTPSSSIVSIIFSRSSSVTVLLSDSDANRCEIMAEIPEKIKETGVSSFTKSVMLGA